MSTTNQTNITISLSSSDMETLQQYMARDEINIDRDLFEMTPEIAIYAAAMTYIQQYLKDNPKQPDTCAE